MTRATAIAAALGAGALLALAAQGLIGATAGTAHRVGICVAITGALSATASAAWHGTWALVERHEEKVRRRRHRRAPEFRGRRSAGPGAMRERPRAFVDEYPVDEEEGFQGEAAAEAEAGFRDPYLYPDGPGWPSQAELDGQAEEARVHLASDVEVLYGDDPGPFARAYMATVVSTAAVPSPGDLWTPSPLSGDAS